MSIWFDPDPAHRGYVRGYLLNRNERCVIGLFGFRAMSLVTTFFSIINDPTLSDYGFEFEMRRVTMNGLDSVCNPLDKVTQRVRLIFVYEPELGHASLATYGEPLKDENNYGNMQRILQFRRAAASPTMLSIIAANPAIDRERGAQSPPSPSVQRVISDPNLDPLSTVPVSEIPCRAQVRDRDARASRLGLRNIAATVEPNGKLGVRYLQFSGPIPGGVWPDAYTASKQERYLQLDASSIPNPSLLTLSGGQNSLRLGDEGCAQAAAADAFFAAFEKSESGGAAKPALAGNSLPRIDDARDFYFFDAAGIDRIGHETMTRVYGTTTVFVPGDLSRKGQWSTESQSMKLRSMVKHSVSGYIEDDLLSMKNEASFFYDAATSKETGSDIWVSIADRREGGLCTKWRDKHFIDNCAERSTAAMHSKHRYYMTADLQAAKRIFHKISQGAVTLSAASLANPARGCERGAFCDLPGGLYLNAIYEGDFERVQQLDEQISGAGKKTFDALLPGDGLTEVERKMYRRTEQANVNETIKKLFTFAFVPDSSLPYLARRYMYQFQQTSQKCFEPGHDIVTKEWIIPDTYAPDEFDQYGYLTLGERIPGSRVTTHYDVNPEFFALCNRVCDAVRPTGIATISKEDRRVREGLDKVMQEYDCASPEIQQFERNLISLTNQAVGAGPRKPFVERSSL